MPRFYKQWVLSSLFVLLGAAGVLAQRTITGTVSSADDGTGLIGATVVVTGTTNGAVTDLDGKYALSNVPNGATLTFSMIGYATQVISVGASNVIDVVLETDALTLGEVTITGAFGVKREARGLTYSAQRIGGTELLASNEQNVVSALQGKVAGALINTTSGAPGAGANIILRGINSLDPSGDNQPLIVVDGVIASNATNVGSVLPSAGTNAFTSGEQFSNTNRLADINPNDIEDISVLKGPAATALYGSLAQNGAIIITTKRGKEGKSTIQLSTTYGVDDINKWPEIQTLYREGISGRIRVNADNTLSTTKFQDYGPPILGNPVYNNLRNLFVQGSRMKTDLSVTGGNKGFSYLLSGSTFQATRQMPLPKTPSRDSAAA